MIKLFTVIVLDNNVCQGDEGYCVVKFTAMDKEAAVNKAAECIKNIFSEAIELEISGLDPDNEDEAEEIEGIKDDFKDLCENAIIDLQKQAKSKGKIYVELDSIYMGIVIASHTQEDS